jgi:uncharacterized protein (DUF697 family)
MARKRPRKPSFDQPEGEGTKRGANWVYRSEGTASARKGGGAAKPKSKPAARTTAARRSVASPTVQPTTSSAAQTPDAINDREKDAGLLVDQYSRYAAAAGLVPVPIVDMVAITGVQVSMLRALAGLYGVPFSQERGRAVVASLLGGLMPTLAGHQILATVAQRLTVVGTLFGMVSLSGFAVAATYAVGRVFTAHFESGGTLLDIDVDTARQRVSAQVGSTSGSTK